LDFLADQGIGRAVGVEELKQARCRLFDDVLVAAGHVAEIHPGVDMGLEVSPAQFRENFGHVIGEQAVAGRVVLGPDFGHLPAGQVSVDAVQERAAKFISGPPCHSRRDPSIRIC
jgi:hypothetical protein